MDSRTEHGQGLHLVGGSLAWLAGLGLQSQQAQLWPVSGYTYLVTLVAVVLLLLQLPRLCLRGVTDFKARTRLQLCGYFLMLGLMVACTAFAFAGWRAIDRVAQVLDPSLEGVPLVVTGVVSKLPRVTPDGVSFEFEVESALRGDEAVGVPKSMLLGWYRWPADAVGEADGSQPAMTTHQVRAAQRWRFTVKLKQPHGLMNPHGFDFELWAMERKLGATGSVRAHGSNVTQPPLLLGVDRSHRVERARQYVKDALYANVHDARSAGVLAALAVGDQSAIDRADWDVFRTTGVAHLMSISGLHVTMFAWLAALAVGNLWCLSRRASLHLPAPVAARIIGVALAGAYAAFSGWGVPSQRTVWMLLTVASLQLSGVRWPWPLVLLVAAVVVTALDPWSLLQPGFWLSFAAVALLLASGDGDLVARDRGQQATGWRRFLAWMHGQARTQVIATVGLAPLTLLFFHQFSAVGTVANGLAIPVVTLIITPLALLGVAVPWLWTLGSEVTQILTSALTWLAARPGAAWWVPVAPWWAQTAGLLGGLIAVAPIPWRLRCWALPLMLPMLQPWVPRPPVGAFEVVAADVGQGTAVLVRTHSKLLVFDTGPMQSAERNAGERVLVPLLRARGDVRIESLVLSHRDADHVGGAASVMAAVPVAQLISSIAPDHPLRQGVESPPCMAGQRWVWDGVHFEVLHPHASDYGRRAVPSNAMSCVLRVEDAAGRSMLLTGDIEAKQEAAILARGAGVRSNVLMVAHHGSKTSSTPAWLQAVAPELGIVQAGYRNRYNHPALSVVRRIESHQIQLVRSDECGAWTRQSDANWHCERAAKRRYWHHRPRSGDGAHR